MKHKVFDILRTFSDDDVKRFRDFLNSPFFNNSNKLNKLYEFLLRYYPKFDLEELSDEALSKRLSPTTAFNKSTSKALFSRTYTKNLSSIYK